ncbi:Planctomycete cytochrome C [Planctomycetes bacterium Pan216]|uniref:Planctomycete cytochrome C n=1 Tax=Kolteria novifilia TaxID=2527975 RepID=A0A518BBC0_9BACT|nr:Planctomycete cytochrome C [Planctomycetes bacterium Pan216]
MTHAASIIFLLLGATPSEADRDRFFEERIAPILQRSCVSCHSSKQIAQASLELDTKKGVLAGGESGAAVVPGDRDESLLLAMVEGPDPLMPRDRPPLRPDEVDLLKEWIDRGAPWPEGLVLRDTHRKSLDWWSLQPLERPRLPALSPEDRGWARTPIDHFILAKLREKGLSPSPEADRLTLIRRLSFDLLGLPPSPEEVDRFLGDPDPAAYEKLVDRMLDSPHYGERWARHWLDVVRYGETHGYDKDKPRPNAWPFRDYVIRSLNEDKPYGRFVREQLAGDVIAPGDADGVIATGFLAAGPWDHIAHVEVGEGKVDGRIAKHLDRDEMVSTTFNVFMSATVGCAQCHHHKFDPIRMEDYYRLHAIFAGIDRADRPLGLAPTNKGRFHDIRRRLADLGGKRAASARKKATAEVAKLDREIAALRKEQSALFSGQFVYAAASDFARQGRFVPTRGKMRPIHLLHRGDIRSPGEVMSPGMPPLWEEAGEVEIDADADEGSRRLALARYLTDRDNPLTWRSIVNRVWLYHLGRGIVDSPNDFGRMGLEPTHPALLDWLAVEFRDKGESLKDLHRLIVTSSVYRQQCRHDPRAEDIDKSNTYFWRMNRRKLEAEEVRDAVLATAGKLDRTLYGPSFMDFVVEKPQHSPHYQYHLHDPDDPATHRRSIYRFVVRSQTQPFLTTLDCADPSQSVAKRDQTTTALQSLALLNNPFMECMSEHVARRVAAERSSPRGQIERAFRLALARASTDSEADALVAYANEHGLANACRVILNLNEFAFID